MAGLIEAPVGADAPREISIRVGDLLQFPATGGRVDEGEGVVELVGAFMEGVAAGGATLTPQGGPSKVLFRALAPGSATLAVMTGDPWSAPVSQQFAVRVET